MIDLLILTGFSTPDATGLDEYYNPSTYTTSIAYLYDYFIDKLSVKIFIYDITRDVNKIPEARFYAISMLYTESIEIRNITNYIKNKYINSKIIIGGKYPTFFYNDVFRNISSCDYIVRGSGIESVKNLIFNDFEDQFVLSRQKNTAEINYDRNEITKSSIFDRTAFYELDWNKVESNILCDKKSNWIITSEGCLYNCSFCTNRSFSQQKISHRNLDDIVLDINNLLKNIPDAKIFLTEPLASANNRVHRSYIDSLFYRIYNETSISLKNSIGIFVKLLDINTEFMNIFNKYSDKIKIVFMIGTDNFNDVILKDMKKIDTYDNIKQKFSLIKNYDFVESIVSNIILGTPKDSKQIFLDNLEKTQKLYNEYKDSHIHLKFSATVLWLLPGSEYYKNRNQYPMFINSNKIDDQIKFYTINDRLEVSIGLRENWFREFQEYKNIYHQELRRINKRV